MVARACPPECAPDAAKNNKDSVPPECALMRCYERRITRKDQHKEATSEW